MNKFKGLLTGWDFARIIRTILAVALGIAYFSTKEEMYLVGAIFLGVQAIFNIGCPGGACKTNIPQRKESEIIKTDEYKPIK